jgi:hypothetical protein
MLRIRDSFRRLLQFQIVALITDFVTGPGVEDSVADMFDSWHLPLRFGTGLVAGFEDSIVGGGKVGRRPGFFLVGLFPLRRPGALVNLCRSCPVV